MKKSRRLHSLDDKVQLSLNANGRRRLRPSVRSLPASGQTRNGVSSNLKKDTVPFGTVVNSIVTLTYCGLGLLKFRLATLRLVVT